MTLAAEFEEDAGRCAIVRGAKSDDGRKLSFLMSFRNLSPFLLLQRDRIRYQGMNQIAYAQAANL